MASGLVTRPGTPALHDATSLELVCGGAKGAHLGGRGAIHFAVCVTAARFHGREARLGAGSVVWHARLWLRQPSGLLSCGCA